MSEMAPMGAIDGPANERQVRELNKCPPGERNKVFKAAKAKAGGKQPTAEQIQQVIQKSTPQQDAADKAMENQLPPSTQRTRCLKCVMMQRPGNRSRHRTT